MGVSALTRVVFLQARVHRVYAVQHDDGTILSTFEPPDYWVLHHPDLPKLTERVEAEAERATEMLAEPEPPPAD